MDEWTDEQMDVWMCIHLSKGDNNAYPLIFRSYLTSERVQCSCGLGIFFFLLQPKETLTNVTFFWKCRNLCISKGPLLMEVLSLQMTSLRNKAKEKQTISSPTSPASSHPQQSPPHIPHCHPSSPTLSIFILKQYLLKAL